MSKAGTYSNQGDDYQRQVAIHWMIQLLSDESIEFMQAESNGLTSEPEKVTVDDIVIQYRDGCRKHIQAKKNQTQAREWSIRDWGSELEKIHEQLEQGEHIYVELYSSTPLGLFTTLPEESRIQPNFDVFRNELSKEKQTGLTFLSKRWKRSENQVFHLLKRITTGSHHNITDWKSTNKIALQNLVIRPSEALDALEVYLNSHQSKALGSKFDIRSQDLFVLFARKGLTKIPSYSKQEILEQFRRTSAIGRNDWKRTIGGKKIHRTEVDDILTHIENKKNTIIVEDRPGSGKTCLLLDLADKIDSDSNKNLLFIKGDRFTNVSETDKSLPVEIVEGCGLLSQDSQVIVIIDSLDVLSGIRDHKTLIHFLNLIDQLQLIQNVTIIAACRTFDLKYDPKLRDRKWDAEIKLDDFDFEKTVVHILNALDVKHEQLNADLKKLLSLPQNLSLFEKLLQNEKVFDIRSTYELYNSFIESSIKEDPEIAEEDYNAIIFQIIKKLQTDREHSVPNVFIKGDKKALRSLISKGVLFEETNKRIGFSHQTVFDNFVAIQALQNDKQLCDMILDNPPLPFFRPSIRSYLFFLRGSSFKAFVKNIKSTLSNDTVAYHFKRLIVETYAEMVPSKNDWALIKWMHIEQPEIFKRFLLSVKSNNWFKLITDTWYNYVITRPNNEEWLNILIAKLAAWMNSFPMETILLWKDALHNEWGRKNAHTICLHFTQFQHYYIDGIGDVIHTLHECTSENPHYFGTIYCKYIEATGKGYEDLWKWMIRDINLSDKDAKNKLYCEDYHLIKGDFLQKHFLKSGVFLNIVLRTLSEWVEQSYYFEWEKFTTRLLEHVRIRENTTIFGTLNIDNLQTLMNAIKEAVLIHSRISSTWWINENKNLVSSKELAFRYILIKAYENNIETNISGIINQLADSELWDTGKLNYELGTLLNKSFHLLPINSQDQIADTIKDLYTNNKESDKNLQLAFEKARFEILIRIPACYRNYDVSNFIEKYITENGYFQPNKKTWPTSGMIKPPISKENLDKLSDKSKKQFFKYFNENKIRSSHPADTLLGGMTEILRLVNELAKNNPIKYILLAENPLFYEFTDSIVKNILEGVGSHIKCRLGVLHDPNFKPILPLPDIKDVARRLLDLIEKNRLMFSNDIDYARMLESCIDALSSKAEIDHIVQLLKPLCTNQESNENRISIQRAGSKNLRYEEIVTNVYNCVRGVAGKSAIKALNKQLELGLEPSKPILKIINKLASDESEVVRASLLMDLGYTSIRNKELGWKIFRVIFNKKQSTLWLLANNFVYHQYYSNFELVRPYLERMKKEALNEAGEIWSKLSALCMINGDYDQENFLNELREINRPEVWEGALSVFIANLEKTSDGVCQTSYCKCLKEEDVRIVFGNLFDSAFRLKKKESI